MHIIRIRLLLADKVANNSSSIALKKTLSNGTDNLTKSSSKNDLLFISWQSG